jgi:hypothetical protein
MQCFPFENDRRLEDRSRKTGSSRRAMAIDVCVKSVPILLHRFGFGLVQCASTGGLQCDVDSLIVVLQSLYTLTQL